MVETHITDQGKGPFFINYSLNGDHYMVGPYNTRRFAMSHIDDVRRIPGVSNVFLGNRGPSTVEKAYRRLLPITATVAAATFSSLFALQIDTLMTPDWMGLWFGFPGLC